MMLWSVMLLALREGSGDPRWSSTPAARLWSMGTRVFRAACHYRPRTRQALTQRPRVTVRVAHVDCALVRLPREWNGSRRLVKYVLTPRIRTICGLRIDEIRTATVAIDLQLDLASSYSWGSTYPRWNVVVLTRPCRSVMPQHQGTPTAPQRGVQLGVDGRQDLRVQEVDFAAASAPST